VQICNAQIHNTESLIIIDEADELLRSNSNHFFSFTPIVHSKGDKGMLNSVLDTVKTPCIWISNTGANELDPSSRRRFDYSIKFEKLNHFQRVEIWKNSIARHGLQKHIPESLLGKCAEKYDVTPGGINLILQNISDIFKSDPHKAENVESLIDSLMAPHCQLLNIATNDNRILISSDYSLEGLNVKGKVTLSCIMSAITQFKKHLEEKKSLSPDAPRMNILLSGPPGTGKTEFVKFLGSKMNSKVLVKMGSDLLDMYVGGTEQKIKAAFREAESENTILFIDEVDGILRSRQMANRSWEVTQVNELLYQMENFKGVLICATNFRKNLDPATIRRFTFKLEFDYLDNSGKEIFYKKMLKKVNKKPLNKSELLRLHSIQPLAPGDFRTVRQGYYYLEKSNIPHSELLTSLELECSSKQEIQSRSIGFGNF
jgi:SpoVK/Ycf46/Vps4 family AAA+-type ATPase